ncbi:hypothetical protein HY733_03210 [Candidatus Uhrbacteria bacterium]|nr:hypothetical protein [Candidatus Uhrbacteria bacterium]
MGMILPWRFVRQGFVPRVDDFGEVAGRILGIASRERVFKGAAFVGSLARGDLHHRSDLDLILVALDRQFDRAQELERYFLRVACTSAVPLDSRLWSASDARLGRHVYGPSYLQTFPREETLFSVGVPLGLCFRLPTGSSVQREMVEKLEHKLRSTRVRAHVFFARQADSNAVESWLLSNWGRVVRPLRVHITIGRRLLWWLRGSLESDGKAEVVADFLAEDAFAVLHADYRQLLAIDWEYDELLARAHRPTQRRDRYLRKVGDLIAENFRVSLRLLSRAVSLIKRATSCAA